MVNNPASIRHKDGDHEILNRFIHDIEVVKAEYEGYTIYIVMEYMIWFSMQNDKELVYKKYVQYFGKIDHVAQTKVQILNIYGISNKYTISHI